MSISDDDYVGYGHPPKQHQFQPGKSGNRKGRPPKPKRSITQETQKSILRALSRKVRDANGRLTQTSVLEAGALNCLQKAVKSGDIKALLTLYDRAIACEQINEEKPPTTIRIEGGFNRRPLQE